VNIARTRRRAAAGIIAAALLVSACGGGDSSSTADEAPVTTVADTDTETVTEYDLVRVSPANREAITAELEASAVFHVWDGSRLTVLSSDEATVEDYIDTLIAADVSAAGGEAGGGEGVKNNAIASWFNKTTKSASDAYNGGVKGYESWSEKNIKRVSKEYRNASGEVVDGVSNVVKWLPKSWPKTLEGQFLKQVVLAALKQLDSAMDPLEQLAAGGKGPLKQLNSLGQMTAADAEKAVNNVLSNYKVQFPKMTLFAGKNWDDRSSYAAVPAPITVKIKRDQWADLNGMNLQLNLDFLGITRYQVQFGCLGFPNGWKAAPTFTLNGGCDNPWNLMASADMVASSAKKVADQAGRELESMSDLILAVLTSAAEGADNPRNVPPSLLGGNINEWLVWCCSLGADPTRRYESQMPTSTSDQIEQLSAIAKAFGNMSKDAALVFTIPLLQDLTYEISPTLTPVAIFDKNWTAAGEMEFGLVLGFFGSFSATVKIGCVTFGTTWSETPSHTFEGGCDKSWGVEFAAE
jgi:hypothetical protein